ncbi:ATPase family AAA domain-containing protein 5 [Athalia rosae]|uniref:ATPase family AAA domain-containing protein 5 n=1 Tax=Athalia rosae TaxID=37344 RepID=UPI0020345E78|nr:ATPase family AAA domain-containing protein 5 [Athalia rosae]XP_048514533.1 ATPase family AAA domain-containing protein 5 [Athalia rosae]XP_048514534.1 ATPase family AAA domain-containing protein 5 [Athalia rosae]XP_048514535.1 ATPase family AAA domain-containing protein 5 [Athalia rosae]XP_048514536.1 ATPase family AAA domain-containing protein 5 [Athalia rosae]XP_048514537.1 ATPase family AAA domain-containing protein 5 [Athalia rosae]XP_048514538.1 ATPase family AAA domain-containing pr
MKDLTHYFLSPPKPHEEVSPTINNPNSTTNSGEGNGEEQENSNTENTIVNTAANITSGKTPVQKRSRVKIKISVSNSKDRRCDIIINKDDVVDKTPSPFSAIGSSNNLCTTSGHRSHSDSDNTPLSSSRIDKSLRAESNAFEVLMTRVKPPRYTALPTPSPREVEMELKKSKSYKSKLNETKAKLAVLADRKGYSKRKLAEIEEAELIEKRLEKRAKLFRSSERKHDEENNVTVTGKQKQKRGRKKKSIFSQELASNKDIPNNCSTSSSVVTVVADVHVSEVHVEKNEVKQKPMDNNNHDSSQKNPKHSCLESKNTYLSAFSSFQKMTAKTKTKWKMRVQLNSQSEDEIVPHADGNTTDEDFIFTPKSKTKSRKMKSKQNASENGSEETVKTDESSNSLSISVSLSENKKSMNIRRKKHKIKKSKNPHISPNEKPNFYRKQGISTKQAPSSVKQERTNFTKKCNDSVMILDEDLIEEYDDVQVIKCKKLAPLFVRQLRASPAEIEARKNFLQSGLPEHVKKQRLEQKSGTNPGVSLDIPFPSISHITQMESGSNTEKTDNKNYEPLYKHKAYHEPVGPLPDASCYKFLSNITEKFSSDAIKLESEKFVQVEKSEFEEVLTEIESRCSETRSMWKSITFALNSTSNTSPKKRSKKLRGQKKSDSIFPKQVPDIPNPTWTCKYKPMSSAEIVGNEAAIEKLRNWLSGWRLPLPKNDDSSGDEFYSSDCSSYGACENNKVAVLLGPHGCGKTSSVYAIAKELGYKVLEVNASSKRTGKKIMSDFQEATKSHRVERDQSSTSMPIRKRPLENKVPLNSLILIEDVDLIFEGDDGFVTATCQIAANTRRPIVMTCRELCSHLNKMAPQQQLIHFQSVTGDRVLALLELISLAESGYRLPKSFLNILLRNGDLRQSLLQLQYILLSGPPSITQLSSNISSTLWTDMQSFLYKPAVKFSKERSKKNSGGDRSTAELDTKLMDSLAMKLDTISLVSSLTDVENPTLPPWRRELSPSLSPLEDLKPYSNTADLSTEIADWLQRISLSYDQPTLPKNFEHMTMKRNVKLGIDLALSQAISPTLEHAPTAVDYLPTIRAMCRSEQKRLKLNNKRGNRFHNYLHGLRLASASENVLAAASAVFQEKSN